LVFPCWVRADDHPAAVVGAGVTFDETLAFEAVQDGGQVGAPQPGGGDNAAGWWPGLHAVVR